MASAKILEQKQCVIDEITENVKKSAATVWFDYRGLSVEEMTVLRRQLKEVGSDLKVYKNTLTKIAMDSLDVPVTEYLEGPNAIAFGDDSIAPIKVLANFAKTHDALELRVGIIDGKIANIDELNKLATIPSREGLLTMLAGGMIGIVRDLSICLNMYSEQLDNKEQ